MTYAPKGKEVSLLDYIYRKKTGTSMYTATGRDLAPFSATHRPLLFSFEHNPFNQRQKTPRADAQPEPPPTGPKKFQFRPHRNHKHGEQCEKKMPIVPL
jgi:hypothetical protein